MVQAKGALFEREEQELAGLLKALSHPARLHILKFLASQRTCISGDISGRLPLSRTTVNQHLAALKNAGLVTGHSRGVKVFYCIDTDKIAAIQSLVNQFVNELNISNYHCDL